MAQARKAKTATGGKAAKAVKKPAKAVKKPAKRAKAPAKIVKTTAKSRPEESGGIDNIARLIDHPLVADLLAVGAIAAVAAIADHSVRTRTGEAESGSSKALKAAGKAAAAAVGKRLMTEVDAIKKASANEPTKRGSR
jgi:hypothetical protein